MGSSLHLHKEMTMKREQEEKRKENGVCSWCLNMECVVYTVNIGGEIEKRVE